MLFQSTLPHGSDFHNDIITKAKIIFQSTLPHGSDVLIQFLRGDINISIHAPSRERPCRAFAIIFTGTFQSTLPHGSDFLHVDQIILHSHFNPRSLTGATIFLESEVSVMLISIHAPSRERPLGTAERFANKGYFNPRSLTGATQIIVN